jgi:hypothetical protein
MLVVLDWEMYSCRMLSQLLISVNAQGQGRIASIYEKEAMAILDALRKWRHYFLGNKLIIKTY